MRLKYTFVLIVMVLALGFTSTPGRNDEAENILRSEMGIDTATDLRCSIETKRSAVRRSFNGRMTVSINSNWVCQ